MFDSIILSLNKLSSTDEKDEYRDSANLGTRITVTKSAHEINVHVSSLPENEGGARDLILGQNGLLMALIKHYSKQSTLTFAPEILRATDSIPVVQPLSSRHTLSPAPVSFTLFPYPTIPSPLLSLEEQRRREAVNNEFAVVNTAIRRAFGLT